MQPQYVTLAITILISFVDAFPRLSPDQLQTYLQHSKDHVQANPLPDGGRKKRADNGYPASPSKSSKRSSTFNAQDQLVDVTGKHTFIPPNFEDGDQRGPCPGLNALANHNYLPRNGVADMLTIVAATNEVFGMSLDLGALLAIIGTVFDGNPVSLNPGYSIGGPSDLSQNILGSLNLLGTPTGLSGSHNKYETDVSATRGDLYVTGNNIDMDLNRFMEYYYALPENTPSPQQYSALAPLHKQRFDESVSTNPYFFFSPFAGLLVSPAGYSFPPRMMSNHSAEYPEGYLSRQTFATFFGVTGDNPDNFIINHGCERIPENWYKRPLNDEFSTVDYLVDVVEHAAYDPRLLSIGGNTGKPNSFTPVDLGNLTGGTFNAAILLQGNNNLLCFVMQTVMAVAPGILGTTFKNVQGALTPLTDNISSMLANLTCPQLEKYDEKLFEKYPGVTQAYGSYAGLSKLHVIEAATGILGGLIPTGQK